MAFISQDNTLTGVLSDLKNGKRFPCYLLYGNEDYLINDALHKIIDIILPTGNRELNLFFVDGETESSESIKEFITTPPLIPGEKIVVARNMDVLRTSMSQSNIISKMLNVMDSDPLKAARHFMTFLKKAGLKLDDLQHDHWKKIPESDWKKILTGDEFEKREEWIPRMLDLSIQYGLDQESEAGDIGLEDILRKGIPGGNYVILIAESVDKRKSIYKTILEMGVVLDFSSTKTETKQKEIAGNISREILAKSGKALSPAAFQALGKKTGFDLKAMTGAIEKLSVYAGDKESIDEKDISALIKKTQEESVFSLTASIAERNTKKALAILSDLLDQGLHHLMILSMVVREVRILLYTKLLLQSGILVNYKPGLEYGYFQKNIYPVIKDMVRSGRGSADMAGLHPYVLYNAFRDSAKFSLEECIGFMEYLLEIDLMLKTTGQDPKILMERLLIFLCNNQAIASPTDAL